MLFFLQKATCISRSILYNSACCTACKRCNVFTPVRQKKANDVPHQFLFTFRGLEKFGDLCFPCFDTLNRPLKEQPLINIGLSHEHRRLDCVLTLDLVLRLQRFDLK